MKRFQGWNTFETSKLDTKALHPDCWLAVAKRNNGWRWRICLYKRTLRWSFFGDFSKLCVFSQKLMIRNLHWFPKSGANWETISEHTTHLLSLGWMRWMGALKILASSSLSPPCFFPKKRLHHWAIFPTSKYFCWVEALFVGDDQQRYLGMLQFANMEWIGWTK